MQHCTRCHGLMVYAGTVWDAAIHTPDDNLPALWEAGDRQVSRCVNCGYVSDPVIEHNRRTPALVYTTESRNATGRYPSKHARVIEPGAELQEARCVPGPLAGIVATELSLIWQGGD